MESRIILLTDKAFSEDVAAKLRPTGAVAAVDFAFSRAELEAAVAQDSKHTRLISFAGRVIVPDAVLAALPGPAYNFHPGPPNYRGLFPSVFALYDQATSFGVTCHEMTAEVDSGPIVAVERFPIAADFDRETLDGMTYAAMLSLVEKLAAPLREVAVPLPRCAETWSGPIRRRADFDALCRLPANATEAEFKRRLRAVGEGPRHALSVELFGREFRLTPKRDGAAVMRGGKKI
ncbi:MAG: formyltransferase family protein [Rhodospirillaceae bacterium]|nr:formyltransferase family protein [Rhodospirillaceae bacterium]